MGQEEIWSVKYFKLNEKKTYQNLWNAAKAMLVVNFIVLYAYIRKEERFKFNNLNFYHRKL